MMNNYELEAKLYQEGKKYIAGTDEVGRGPLAGPVVATAVIMPKMLYRRGYDSKKLSEKKRKLLRTKIEENALSLLRFLLMRKQLMR